MSGIVCSKCSTFTEKVRHPSVAAVKACCAVRVAKSPSPVVAPVVTSTHEFVPAPVVEAPAVRPALAAGQVWILDGTMWQVRKARSSDRLFGFELVNEPSPSVRPVWEYRGMARRFLGSARLASVEELREFGHRVQCCVYCSIQLDDERSRWAGYGEKCASNHGLPWGERPPVGWAFGG